MTMNCIKSFGLALCMAFFLFGCRDHSSVLSLEGNWEFALDSTDIGMEERWFERPLGQSIHLPGTTDDAGYGVACTLEPSICKPQILHLTRKHRYVGPAWYAREVNIPAHWEDKHIELKLERTLWQTRVWVDGIEAGSPQESLVTPHRYDLTPYLTPGAHRIVIRVDNRKRYDISTGDMAHAYTDHTQIIWNGILGEISLTARDDLYLTDVQVYPDVAGKQIRVKGLAVNGGGKTESTLSLSVKKTEGGTPLTEQQRSVWLEPGTTELDLVVPMSEDTECWSEFTPQLYDLHLQLSTSENTARGQVRFGMRQLSHDRSDLLLNGRKIFLRGTLECCVFPLTGRPPMTVEEWTRVLTVAREWGLNHLRFHSWCPPEAAFEAADRMGFYLQVELPMWSLTVGQDEGMNNFLYAEAAHLLAEYGNHPSFCFLSLGNELQPDFDFLSGLLRTVKATDPRHLYTTTSFTFEPGHGNWPETDDDYFITQWTRKGWVRGQGVFNSESPDFSRDYTASVDSMPVPVVTHEIGQYAVYPDLKEIDRYTGVLDPLNLKGIRDELAAKGLLDKADDYLKASGRLAFLLYKEEMERAMKTPGISGIQLLGLQDFPGQGTALVGLLNAFWESKDVARAEEFRAFSSPVVPLVRFPKAIYVNSETFTADLEMADYGPGNLEGKVLRWELSGVTGRVFAEGEFPLQGIRPGGGNMIGHIACPLGKVQEAERLTLKAQVVGTDYQNSWHLWVYPATIAVETGEVVVTNRWEQALQALQAGRDVFFNPLHQECEGVEGKFVPVFWSPVHFPHQAGTMGLLLNPSHPAFAHFPTENHTDWQWWSLATQSRALVIDSVYQRLTPLIECVDNFARNRRLTMLFETRCMNGRLLFCSMDLLDALGQYPEKQQMLYSLLTYMQSADFHPESTLTPEEVASFLLPVAQEKKEYPNSVY